MMTKKSTGFVVKSISQKNPLARETTTRNELFEAYRRNPFVFASVNAKANEFAKSIIRLVKVTKDKEESVDNFLALDHLRMTLCGLTMFELMSNMSIHLDVVGEFYLEIVKTPSGNAVQGVRLLNPLLISKNQSGNWVYSEEHMPRIIPFDQVVQKKDSLCHFDYGYGKHVSPVSSCYTAIKLMMLSEHWNADTLQNGGHSNYHVTLSSEMPKEDLEEMSNYIKRHYSGDERNRKMITSDHVKVNTLGQSPKDMEFVKTEEWGRKKILAALQLPITFIGDAEGVNLANADALERSFMQNVIDPRLRKFVDMLNYQVLPMYNTGRAASYRFVYDKPYGMTHTERIQTWQVLWNTQSATQNEIRAAFDLEPSDEDGADELNGGSVSLVGFPEPEEEKSANGLSKKRISDREYLKRVEEYSKRVRSRLITFFKSQEKELLSNLAKADKAVSNSDIPTILFGVDAEGDRLKGSMRTLIRAIMIAEGKSVLGEIGGGEFSFGNTLVQRAFDLQLNRIADINQTTFDDLNEQLKAGVQAGEGIEKLRKRVKATMKQATTFRADTIAKTEVLSAISSGRTESMRQNGVKKKEWVTSGINVRESHSAASGQIVDIDEPFIVGGESLDYPGDPAGSAENVINCVCRTEAVFE